MKMRYMYQAVVAILLCLMLSGFDFSAASAASGGDDEKDLMAMLTKDLKLSQDQSKQLEAEIEKFAKTLDGL